MAAPRPLLTVLARPLSTISDGLIFRPLAQRTVLPVLVGKAPFPVQARAYIPSTCPWPVPRRPAGQLLNRWPPCTMRSIVQQRAYGTAGISSSLLASREATANRNPNSATVQNAFYQLLLKANMPAIVVERYQSGLYASNEAADAAYVRALDMLNHAPSTSLPATGLPPGGVGQTPPAQGANNISLDMQAAAQAAAARVKGGSTSISIPAGMAAGGKNEPLYVVVTESRWSIILRWVKVISTFIFLVYIIMVITTLAAGFFDSVDAARGRKKVGEVIPEQQKTRFSDVHGCDEAKEELQEVVEFLKNPEGFSSLGGKLPRGVLIVGAPGTGKTLLARAVAGEAGVPFFYMSGSEFDEMYVGVGARRVRELFKAAKEKSPAIIFIDELDAVGAKRSPRDAAYHRQTLNQLLTELDGFETDSGVVVIGATNFPKSLDKALVRPGRFDRHITVDLPDVRGRLAILGHHARKVKVEKNIKWDIIARQTSGLSGAELENIVNLAAVQAAKSKVKAVGMSHLLWALDKVLMGAEKRPKTLPEDLLRTAYHEAGHTLALLYQPNPGQDFHKVTILARGGSLGHTAFTPFMDKGNLSHAEYASMIRTMLGGKVAEAIVYGADKTSAGVSSDLSGATRTAFNMVTAWGMSPNLASMAYSDKWDELSSETRAAVEQEVQRILNVAEDDMRSLLTAKRRELDLLAHALIQYETLDKTEVLKVIRGEKLVDRVATDPQAPMVIPVPQDKPSLVDEWLSTSSPKPPTSITPSVPAAPAPSSSSSPSSPGRV